MESILHPLTNRGTPFIWPRFPQNAALVPRTLSPAATGVAGALRLTATDTDYYLLGVLHALAGSPALLEEVGRLSALHDLSLYPVPDTGWAGASLIAGALGPAKFARVPTVWPVDLLIRVSYFTTDAILITTGAQSWTKPLYVTSDDRMRVEWPEEFHASGLLDLATPWAVGSSVEIYHHPASYPFGLVAAYMGARRDTNQLLLETGTAGLWQGAASDLERVAVLAVSLIKAYNAGT